MPNWLLVNGNAHGFNQAKNLTKYAWPCSYIYLQTTEDRTQFVARDSYTLSKLFVRVTANTITAATKVRIRINGADGNQLVSIPANTAGTFQDMVYSDSLVDGDLFNYESDTPNAGTSITFTIMSVVLETASNNTPIIGASGGTAETDTSYFSIGGDARDNDTESETQYTFRVAATLSNLRCHVRINSAAIETTLRTRVNGGNGNQSVAIPLATTGTFEDAVHTDVIASGNNVNLQKVGDGGKTTFSYFQLKSTSAGRQTMAADSSSSDSQGSGLTRYGVIEDELPAGTATEADAQVITEIAFTAKNLFVRVIANTLNGSTTVCLRQNGISTALSVSIGATATGVFEDSDSVSIAVDDLLNYMVVTEGSSGSITINIIGFEQGQPAAPPGLENKSAGMAAKMIAGKLI